MSMKKKVGVLSARGAAQPLSQRAVTPRTAVAAHALAPQPSSAVPALAADGGGAAAMMNPYGLGVGSVSCTSLYWHNLLLLGFNPAAQSARHKLELSANMFDRPNARAMQLLLHFLLTAIKACPQADAHNEAPEWKEMLTVRAQRNWAWPIARIAALVGHCDGDAHCINTVPDLLQIFQHSYPCIERTQTRDFLHVCVQVLTGFEKGPVSVFPPGTIRKSHFAAPQGERSVAHCCPVRVRAGLCGSLSYGLFFVSYSASALLDCVLCACPLYPSLYTIFWHLSSYALHLTLQRDHPTYVVPSLTLPSLADHALFPHTIKAMKTHIVRQSQLYITKLQRMQTAEEGWRAAAADITAEYQSCQAQMAELVVPAAPRIPGQPVPEIESDRLLFSAPAHAEVSIHPPAATFDASPQPSVPQHVCGRFFFLTRVRRVVDLLSLCRSLACAQASVRQGSARGARLAARQDGATTK